MLAECTAVIEGRFEIDVPVAVLVLSEPEVRLALIGTVETQVPVLVEDVVFPQPGSRVLASGEIESVLPFRVIHVTLVVDIECDQRRSRKALAPLPEIECLGYPYVGIKLVVRLVCISPAGQVGIRVPEITCSGNTGH